MSTNASNNTELLLPKWKRYVTLRRLDLDVIINCLLARHAIQLPNSIEQTINYIFQEICSEENKELFVYLMKNFHYEWINAVYTLVGKFIETDNFVAVDWDKETQTLIGQPQVFKHVRNKKYFDNLYLVDHHIDAIFCPGRLACGGLESKHTEAEVYLLKVLNLLTITKTVSQNNCSCIF